MDVNVRDMNGIDPVRGRSFEQVLRTLEEEDVWVEVGTFPGSIHAFGGPFFRKGSLRVKSDDEGKVLDVLGNPYGRLESPNMLMYTGEYELTPEFDISVLTGTFKFNEGRLVELTNIYLIR